MPTFLKTNIRRLANVRCALRTLVIVTSVLTTTACSTSSSAPTQCTSTQGCPAGQICRNEACIFLCSADADCGHNEICNGATSLCEACTNCRQVPEISSLNGTGTHDTTPGHASQHIANTILLTGNHFSGGQVQLTGGNYSDYVLAAAGTPTNTQMEVFLPSNLTPGTYQLRISNQAGADTAEATVLQGEQGIPGVYVAGDGIDVNGDTISVHYAGTNNAFGTATTPARSDHTHGTLYALQTDFSALSTAHDALNTSHTALATLVTNNNSAVTGRVTTLESGLSTLQTTLTDFQSSLMAAPFVELDINDANSYAWGQGTSNACTNVIVHDISGDNNTFAFSGTPQCLTDSGGKKFVRLNSSDDYLSGPMITLPPLGYTLEIVMALETYASTNGGNCFINHGTSTTTRERVMVCQRVDSNVTHLTMEEWGNSNWYPTTSGFTDAQKYHFTFVHEDNNRLSIYQNGILKTDDVANSGSFGLYGGDRRVLRIDSILDTSGTRRNLDFYFLRIYNRALSPTEILSNYNAYNAR